MLSACPKVCYGCDGTGRKYAGREHFVFLIGKKAVLIRKSKFFYAKKHFLQNRNEDISNFQDAGHNLNGPTDIT